MLDRLFWWISPEMMLILGLICLIFGSVASTIGTVRSMLEQNRQNESLAANTSKIQTQTEALRKLNESIDRKSELIANQTSNLETLNRELAERSKNIANDTAKLQAVSKSIMETSERTRVAAIELFNRYTGGLSYAVVRLNSEYQDKNRLVLDVFNSGPYALYNLEVKVRDLDVEKSVVAQGRGNTPLMEMSRKLEHEDYFDVLLPAHFARLTFDASFPPGADKQLSIQMFARNGMVLEKLRIIRTGEKTVAATRVWRYLHDLQGKSEREDVIEEQAQPGFPLDGVGKPVWRK